MKAYAGYCHPLLLAQGVQEGNDLEAEARECAGRYALAVERIALEPLDAGRCAPVGRPDDIAGERFDVPAVAQQRDRRFAADATGRAKHECGSRASGMRISIVLGRH